MEIKAKNMYYLLFWMKVKPDDEAVRTGMVFEAGDNERDKT